MFTKICSLNHTSKGHTYCQDRVEKILNFVQLQKMWTI